MRRDDRSSKPRINVRSRRAACTILAASLRPIRAHAKTLCAGGEFALSKVEDVGQLCPYDNKYGMRQVEAVVTCESEP